MRFAVAVVCLALAGCPNAGNGKDTTPDPSDNGNPRGGNPCGTTETLYERLGGLTSIRRVVDELMGTVAADSRINAFFVNADIRELKVNLVDHICKTTGGPCEYKGRDMKSAHEGLGVTEAHYAAMIENLQKTLDKFGVPQKEQGELINLLGTAKDDIVEQ